MSRKGKQPITVPSGVDIKLNKDHLQVKGPKGTLECTIPSAIILVVTGNQVEVKLADGAQDSSNLHGLYRTLIDNMVKGTVHPFETKLEMVGVGYRAAVQGKILDLQIGCSHPTQLHIPQGIEVKIEKNTQITVIGINKQSVGQFAASIRAMKPPEPYQGKGIRYSGEYVRKKAGKAAAKK
jgi:ribosomal protein L6, bacterial type